MLSLRSSLFFFIFSCCRAHIQGLASCARAAKRKIKRKGNDLSTHPISTTNYMRLCGGGSVRLDESLTSRFESLFLSPLPFLLTRPNCISYFFVEWPGHKKVEESERKRERKARIVSLFFVWPSARAQVSLIFSFSY
jgi:hypothetical protein